MSKIMSRILAGMALAAASNLGAYELTGAHWASPSTTMHPGLVLNGNQNSASGLSWSAAFTEAIGIWNAAQDSFTLLESAPASDPCAGIDVDGDEVPDYPSDGIVNGVGFNADDCVDPFGDGVLALTISWVYTSAPDEVIESDILFNSTESWDVYHGALLPATDFRRVAVHELGHVMGLDHEEVDESVMAPYVGDIEVPQPDDLAGVAAIYGSEALDPMVMTIEEPFNGAVQSGISTFRGWIVSLHGIASLELFQDGVSKGMLQHDGPRNDVCSSYPEYPDCAISGFAFGKSWGLLTPGAHTLRLDAVDNQLNTLSKTVSFTVSNYEDAYVADPAQVTLDSATVSKSGEDILVNGLMHNGKEYDLRMRWRTQSQDFEPVEIIRQ